METEVEIKRRRQR